MIRMIQSQSSRQAKSYFNDSLQKSDYYLESQEIAGFKFHGKIAERLGITEKTSKDNFHALVENIHPLTGQKLTARTKDNRTIGYDINFHCPKSVSVLHVLSKDNHILDAFKQSVQETMLDIEQDAKVRVRKSGQDENRETGELLWADFIHQTARPVEGFDPDPHLHAHCYTFNISFDKTEQQFKAGQFRDIKRDMPFYQARFHKRLSDTLMNLGYGIRRTEKSFEVESIPQQVMDLFSKRTNEIGQIAKSENITDAKELDKLGARTRAKKQQGFTMAQLKQSWRQQITDTLGNDPDQQATIVRQPKAVEGNLMNAQGCVDHALSHCFERASVVHDRRILEKAYRYSIESPSASLEAITSLFKSDSRIVVVDDGSNQLCTTSEVLAEESRMVAMAQNGKGKLSPLYTNSPPLTLDGDQANAVRHVLTSCNRVSIIRGGAGTGKTTLMKEAVRLMEAKGKSVIVTAPSAQAARGVLRDEGFGKAETVAKLLSDETLQKSLQDQVLWVDEAGLLGTKDMIALLELATTTNARLILTGDTRQHASVVRGDALRILNTVADIPVAEVGKIYRQKIAMYKEAVQALADGDIKEAFDKLTNLDAIHEITSNNLTEKLAGDYLASIQKGRSALIISPTHKQGDRVTRAIRDGLKENKRLDKTQVIVSRLVNLNLTEAEKSDPRHYKDGNIIQFNQNCPGILRGERWEVEAINKNSVEIKKAGKDKILLPLAQSNSFDAFKKTELEFAKGDKVLLTRNGFDQADKRLNNGDILDVKKIEKDGMIILRNQKSKAEYTLASDFGHWNHAYCITSHSSQGKTVDDVFIAQPAATFPATNMKQFYVSVSRARHNVHIYTDDKEELLKHASEKGDRLSAIELINPLTNPLTINICQQLKNEQTEPIIAIEKQQSQKRSKPHEPKPTL